MTMILGIAAALLTAAPQNTQIAFDPINSGGTKVVGGYSAIRLALTPDKPASVTKAPNATTAAYGVIQLGPANAKTSIIFLLDESEGQTSKLYVDANANGDLTDDPVPAWAPAPYKGSDGKDLTRMNGDVTVNVKYGEAVAPLHLVLYKFDKNDAGRAGSASTLFYYSDYAREGKLTLSGKEYRAVLADMGTTGDFSSPTIKLLINVNANGKFDARGEQYDAAKPFNIGGTTYELKNIMPSGAQLALVKSSRTVAEILPRQSTSVGKTILNFQVTTTDGTAVSFPSAYKGKVIMLDFWATWCGPCMAEVPGLVTAYNKYKNQGFEILGVTLDKENDLAQVGDVTKRSGMTWKQVLRSDIADMFGVQTIPAAILVDGDTGEILASGGSLRGELLEGTIEDALKKKAGS